MEEQRMLIHNHQQMPRFAPHCCLVLFSVFFISSATAQLFDYADALTKSLLYFESQRSGRLPYNQRVDLVGGYYDAGDHVKFGLPMAFTVTMLSWGVIEFRDQIANAGELEHALEAIKWGTDYFIKAHTSLNVLWAEDMTTSRRAYKIDENNPGSDLAGETAAAMAAASVVFKETNPHYSHLLLHHAQELFEFGDKYRGKYDGSVGVVKRYYASVSGFMDELLWAALWLYEATDREDYLKYVINEAHCFGGIVWAISEFSWGPSFGVKAKLEQEAYILKQYRSKAEYYLCSCLNKNNARNDNIERTPGGLLYVRQWNNMQYVSTALFLLTVYSDFLYDSNEHLRCPSGTVDREEILNFAKYQVYYILGSNPMNMSYLVGYGSKYPTRVHHRGASIVSYRENKGFIGCTQGYDNWYGLSEPNPNVLVGALIGGTDCRDNFMDQRDNYMQTEACTYNTAPLVGVFARLLQLEESHEQELVASF
ncbi:Endoglucanase 11 [Hibiscus syriacus]|uniref:Endoglucanase n=1 Tax=Hibiscus syriacus TaxID=106335 RepID=A0A6A3CGE4_HIBSY|nr:Endoglucanase 11 [Hibiscus syriacus]